jgi:uncharacterized lipoprotein YajG
VLALLLFIMLLYSCSVSPVVVRESFVAPSQLSEAHTSSAQQSDTHQASKQDERCEIRFVELTDARTERTLLGTVSNRQVYSRGEGAEWLREMLSTGLARHGVSVSQRNAVHQGNRVVSANARLMTTWVSTQATTKIANIVLSFTFLGDGNARSEKFYRGTQTSINWSAGTNEIQTMLDQAFEDLLTKLSDDLGSMCARLPSRQ